MTDTLHSFDLNHLAARVVRDSTSPDPGVMAEALVALIDPEHYRAVLLELARGLIRQMVRARRPELNGSRQTYYREGSPRVAAARDAWKRLLDTPEYVPSSGWLFLRDATREQVLEMAGMRTKKAAELTAAAGGYRAIADAMAERKASKVSELPDDILGQLLDAKAATA